MGTIIAAAKIFCMIASAFFLFYIIGCMKMGDEEFQIWLGGKLIGAWRRLVSSVMQK